MKRVLAVGSLFLGGLITTTGCGSGSSSPSGGNQGSGSGSGSGSGHGSSPDSGSGSSGDSGGGSSPDSGGGGGCFYAQTTGGIEICAYVNTTLAGYCSSPMYKPGSCPSAGLQGCCVKTETNLTGAECYYNATAAMTYKASCAGVWTTTSP
jgi:hypothetical protein